LWNILTNKILTKGINVENEQEKSEEQFRKEKMNIVMEQKCHFEKIRMLKKNNLLN
jgi:ribosomal protein L24